MESAAIIGSHGSKNHSSFTKQRRGKEARVEQQSGVTGMEFQANVSSGGNFRGYYVQLINKTTIRIINIIINVDDIFLIIIRTICYFRSTLLR